MSKSQGIVQFYHERIRSIGKYSLSSLQADLLSGVIVALVALPLAMSFSISAGLDPQLGLYAAIAAGLIAGIVGGSNFTIAGPAGAFIAILFSVVLKFGYEKMLVTTIMAGVIMIIVAIFRLGSLVRYIPYPVIVGFTSGIAVVILSTQLTSIFGLSDIEKHEYFHQNIMEVASHLGSTYWPAVMVTVITAVAMVAMQRWKPKLPAALIGIVAATIIAIVFQFQVSTIESVYGVISATLPAVHVPQFYFSMVPELIGPALAIAGLAMVETLLTSVVADGMTKTKHHSNAQLVGVGMANVGSALVGGIPVSGVIARTGLNIRAGGKTRMANIFHGLILLAIMLLFAPLVSKIPLAALAGVLLIVAGRMLEPRQIIDMIRFGGKSDAGVLLVTLLLTVFLDLTISIPIGLVLAALLFLRDVSKLEVSHAILDRDKGEVFVPSVKPVDCPHISVFNIDGPLFFGAVHSAIDALDREMHTQGIILRLHDTSLIDVTGINALRSILHIHKPQRSVYLCGLQPQVKDAINKSSLLKEFGENRIFDRTKDAINQALKDQDATKSCEYYEYREE